MTTRTSSAAFAGLAALRGRARPRSLALIAAALALAAAALYQAAETVRSQRRTAARLVRDYGAFAAWSYRHRAGEVLRAQLRWTFSPVVHVGASAPAASPPAGAAGALTADAWRRALAAMAGGEAAAPCGGCAPPSYYVRVPLRGGPAREAVAGDFAGQPVDHAKRRQIVAALRAHAAGPARPDGDFAIVHLGGRTGAVAYVRAGGAASTGDASFAYGVELDPSRYAALFRVLFATGELLPPAVTGGRHNAALLGVEARGWDGTLVYRSSDPAGWAAASDERLEAGLGGFTVRAAVLHGAAGPLAGGGLPGSRLPLIAGLLALAGGLALVAVRQARRDAELTRLRADFVSSVSHELRTPLAQVQIFIDTLRLGRYRTEAQREWILDGMQRETTRLTGLVDNVLHLASAERGRGRRMGDMGSLRSRGGGGREPTELGEYIRGVVADFAPLAGARGAVLRVQCEPGLRASLHRESFRRALLNLLDNAVKYGPERGIVHVTTAAAHGRLHVTVADRGPGVDPREAGEIFEPFRRGARAVGSDVAGSGIGLSVAREIVEAHDGRIAVQPNPGGGARFVIELPADRSEGAHRMPQDDERVATGEIG